MQRPHRDYSAILPLSYASGCSSKLPSSSPDSLRILLWDAGGRPSSNAELLHLILLLPFDLICVQESNFNLSSSFRILAYFALRFDRTPFRLSVLFPDDHHVSGGVITFVMLGLPFSDLSTSFLFA